MSEAIKISTSKYKKEGKVDIDGNIWSVKLPGAGTELRLSQAFRASKLWSSRIALLDKKIDSGTITETDLDNYEEFSKKYEQSERTVFEFFLNVFQDGTKDNTSVKKWVEETPTHIIQRAFEDIKDSAAGDNDGQKEPSKES